MSRSAQRKSKTRAHQLASFHLLRSRRNATRKRNKEKLDAFGAALRDLAKTPHEGGSTLDILRRLMGGCEIGEIWLQDFETLITRGMVADGIVAEGLGRSPDSQLARRLARFGVRMLARLRRGAKRGLVLVGRKAFWGRVLVELQRDELADLEREAALEATGAKAPPRKRKRGHVPAAQAGGLAAENQRSPRTIGRWARLFRHFDLIGSRQPRATDDDFDVVMPKGGSYAYPVWSALKEPPRALMHALQELWGEVVPEPAPAPKPRPQRPPQTASAAPAQPTGPPAELLPGVDWTLRGKDLYRAIQAARATA